MKTPAAVLFATAAALAASVAAANPETPYEATILRSKVDVLSGPGEQYYRTAVLTEGSRVEVHRKVGGFLGIRPPEGSFSWAPATDIKEVEPGVGRVMRDEVPSRVGSLLTEDRNVVHIRLKQGERVRVLSRLSIDGAEWAQIAPPAGEFRWIRAADVERDALEPLPLRSETPVATEPAPFMVEAATDDTPTPINEWVQAAAHTAPAAGTGMAEAPPFMPPATPPAILPPAPATPPQTVAQPKASPVAPLASKPVAALPTGSFEQKLSSLEIELSRRVSQPSSLWQLGDLQASVEQLKTIAAQPNQQAAVQSLSQRTSRFSQIVARQKQIAGMAPRYRQTKSAASRAGAAPGFGVNNQVVGELRPVVSKRPDAPKYAIVGADGKVATFLTPQPGMDLQPLLGKRVIADGVQGYMPAIRSQHIAATKVAQAPPAATETGATLR